MKNLFLLISFTASCFADTTAQSNFSVFIDAPDTAASVFSQNLCKVWVSPIPLHEDKGMPIFDVAIGKDTTFLAVKFPGYDWIMVRPNINIKNTNDFRPFEGILDNYKFDTYLNFIPLFDENPGLFESVKSGASVEIRFQMYANINNIDSNIYNNDYGYIYSNTEKMVLPPATDDDIEAFSYLQGHLKDIRAFSYLNRKADLTSEICQYVLDNYPNSLLFDIAYFHKKSIDLSYIMSTNALLTKGEIWGLLKERYAIFKTSKSDIILDRLREWSTFNKLE
jgi:hypothetical protein